MTIIQSIILGVVQGLTEFLPISSTAHLHIFPWVLNWTEIPGSFDVALHFGSLIAILIFFFKDWLKLFKGGWNKVFKKEDSQEGKIFWYLVIATIPSALLFFVLDKIFDDILKHEIIIALTLIVMGILLYIVDKRAESKFNMKNLTFKQALLIGLSQVLAFIPGMSRSGSTMIIGRTMEVDRETTAKMSFYLSTPIILAATIYKMKDFSFNIPFVIGTVVSFITALLVIKFFMGYIKKGSYKIFAVYRVILGLAILGIYIFKLFV